VLDLSADDRPREKLDDRGVHALGSNELLAVLIGHGTAAANALALANRLIALAGGVHGLAHLHQGRLTTVPGIGPVTAGRIQAAIELGRRTLLTNPDERARFGSPHELARLLLPRYGSHPVERCGVVLLDTRHRIITTRLISVGSLDASAANPREIFREAMLGGAAAVVVFHNHPSGDPTPSRDDVALTIRLRHAGHVVGVDLVDHVILTDVRYCSMKEAGLL
jgi:DNA repair protein RadC